MKKFILSAVLLSLSANSFGQTTSTCEVNPLQTTNLVVSGVFNNETNAFGNFKAGKNDIAYFRNGSTSGTAELVSYISGCTPQVVWSGTLDIEKIRGRVVSLDANGDGLHNEIAAIHDNGNNSITIKLWYFSPFNSSWYHTNVWTSPIGYDATKITNRIVAGDFDNDGAYNDIAALYDYGSSAVKIHVFRFNGITSITYQWYYEASGYNANMTTGRIVSGDFDRDGKVDDIAALYDYGSAGAKMHVFTSNGSSFSQRPYFWEATGYSASSTTGTLVSGNFDKSGLANHKNDDIVAFYDYGNGNVKAHVWTNENDNSFSYSWKWQQTGFNVNEIRGRVFPLQESGDHPEKNYHIGAFYNYGSATEQFYKWTNNFNSNWDFGSSIAEFCPCKSAGLSENEDVTSINASAEVNISKTEIKIYPNPSFGNLYISSSAMELKSVEIYSLAGNKITHIETFEKENGLQLNLESLPKGIYFVHIVDAAGYKMVEKIILE